MLLSVITELCVQERYASRLRLPFNDNCRISRNMRAEETAFYLLCESSALAIRKKKILGNNALDYLCKVLRVKLTDTLGCLTSKVWI